MKFDDAMAAKKIPAVDVQKVLSTAPTSTPTLARTVNLGASTSTTPTAFPKVSSS
jgi:hypothetical protein